MADANITDLGSAIHGLFDAKALLTILGDYASGGVSEVEGNNIARTVRIASAKLDEVIGQLDEIDTHCRLEAKQAA